ncbi:hypothetical protein acdb102_42500 [Acidothermaceae bacterium B102]|nr:hypothetical protein acdb102_42500 [Acidothermaceae bacterium B102]
MNDEELRSRLTLLAERVPGRPDAPARVRATARRRRRFSAALAAGAVVLVTTGAVTLPVVLTHRAARVDSVAGPTAATAPPKATSAAAATSVVSAVCTPALERALRLYGSIQHFYSVRTSAVVAASFAQNLHVSGDPVHFCLAVGDLDKLTPSLPPGVPDQMHYALMAAGTGAPQLVYTSADRPQQPLPGVDPSEVLAYQPPAATALPATTSTTTPTLPTPGPTTLAAAETLALHAAINAGSARIAWGVATTAATLRAAGTSVPSTVPDATPMFMIAVHGDAMTDGGPGTKPTLVHRFGVLYRGDGSSDTAGNAISFGDYFTHLEPPTLRVATMNTLAQLTPTIGNLTQADSTQLTDAIPVEAALAAAEHAAGLKSGDIRAGDVLATLVRTQRPDGLHKIAWLLAINNQHTPAVLTRASEYLVDASTGEAFEAAVP